MCAVSIVGDHYTQKFQEQHNIIGAWPTVSQYEFNQLKKEVEEMKALLLKAKAYDERTNQPHCEQEEKIALLKRMAELVGVSLKEVFPDA